MEETHIRVRNSDSTQTPILFPLSFLSCSLRRTMPHPWSWPCFLTLSPRQCLSRIQSHGSQIKVLLSKSRSSTRHQEIPGLGHLLSKYRMDKVDQLIVCIVHF
ncbi:hypothetical protein KP509_03G065200 [Ceratopteris richardii]|uniref:Uncharacterized protein n=1 Tax=Ceratopteris richardii TaxID=49495 RepID=A0A8T2V7X1_CERRI|nr:hypothetical protein KP509_03G065200 [Ceratopteris richardii]